MRRKQNKVQFYVEADVRKKLEKLAKESGLSMTAVILKLIMDREIKPLPIQEIFKIYNELNHIGNNINQIAYVANLENHISAERINEAAELMEDIWECVRPLR